MDTYAVGNKKHGLSLATREAEIFSFQGSTIEDTRAVLDLIKDIHKISSSSNPAEAATRFRSAMHSLFGVEHVGIFIVMHTSMRLRPAFATAGAPALAHSSLLTAAQMFEKAVELGALGEGRGLGIAAFDALANLLGGELPRTRQSAKRELQGALGGHLPGVEL